MKNKSVNYYNIQASNENIKHKNKINPDEKNLQKPQNNRTE